MTKRADFRDDSRDELIEGVALHLDSSHPPASVTTEVEFGARTRRGQLRTVNEDHYLVMRLARNQQTLLSSLDDDVVARTFEEQGHAMLVADGMSGTGAGEHASRLALVTLVHLVRHFGRWNLRIDDKVAREIMDRAKRFYRHVDNAIAQRAGEGESLQTTLTAVFGAGRDLFFAHVGHSRAYLFRAGQLMRLTRDHTRGRQRASTLPLAPLVAVNDSARDLVHVLSDTIGMPGSVGPLIDIERFQLFDGDIVLVCSNGLTDAVDEQAIASVLASAASPDAKCQALVDLAWATKEADDDVTAVIGQYRLPLGTSG